MKKVTLLIAVITLSGCSSMLAPDDKMKAQGHLGSPAPEVEQASLEIPPVVEQVPIIAAPEPDEPLQTFTVVATDLPASELLFALARDARLNLDIDPSIDARISINAIDQTMPQILRRISRQVALRYYLDGPNLVIEKDRPFVRLYRVDYLNMSRETVSTVGIETTMTSDSGNEGGSSGDSSTKVINETTNNFWQSLEDNILLLATLDGFDGKVISHRESGTISVLAPSAAHENIQLFIDTVVSSARRQVLIEATIVEVTLNDQFQGGVDWASIAQGDGWSLQQSLLGGALGTAPFTSATFLDTSPSRTITAAVKALDAFGETSVMSSPKIMVLNNQTAVLKVADNTVYFDVDATQATSGVNAVVTQTFDTTVKTVPVGFVMNVTPYISASSEVILNIRPTITRILRFVPDPNPSLALAGVESLIPEIQVREFESVLRVASGNTAVLGGLMQDSADQQDAGVPGLHRIQGAGFLFGAKDREYRKTELVIFLRPRIIENASIETNLQDFKKYLNPEIFSQPGG